MRVGAEAAIAHQSAFGGPARIFGCSCAAHAISCRTSGPMIMSSSMPVPACTRTTSDATGKPQPADCFLDWPK